MYIHHVFSQVFFTEFPQGSTIFSALVAMIPATCPAMAVAMLAGSCAAVCATARPERSRHILDMGFTWDSMGFISDVYGIHRLPSGYLT